MIPLFFLAMAASEAPSATAGARAPTAQMEKVLQDCDAHKFETAVITMVDGQPHQSKVKLCGTKGQTDAAWMNTLKDAITKVKANDNMAPEIRQQIASALDAELQRLSLDNSLARITKSAPGLPGSSASPSILALKPRIPQGAVTASTRPLSEDYGSLPPLPSPKAAIPITIGASSILASLPAPRMSLRCGSSDDPNEFDACATISSDTILFVRAEEQVPAGTSLRFVRRDDSRGEVALAALRSGQTARIPLPHRVCDGVVRSKLQIDVLRKPAGANATDQVVDTLGPYELHC